MLKRILKGFGVLVVVVAVAAVTFVGLQVRAYNASFATRYEVPLPKIVRSADPAVLERGKHLAESLGGCATADCHGGDLGGGKAIEMGPVGKMPAPNITPGGTRGPYSDGELARLILHGIKKDGHSVTFMPSQDFTWWPDDDVQAVVSYISTVPAVVRADGQLKIGILGKVLDRRDLLPIDIARRIDHEKRPTAPRPEPTAAYGAFIGRMCFGCHGTRLSGGPIPGAPKSMAVPKNITPHETGLRDWTFADFDRLLVLGMAKNGKKVDPTMPTEALGKMNDVEKQALWAYLRSVPAAPFGGR
jgi:mono/diheme cytochrome c family protein